MFYRKDDDDDAMSGELNERFSHEIPQENSFRGQSYGKKVLTWQFHLENILHDYLARIVFNKTIPQRTREGPMLHKKKVLGYI